MTRAWVILLACGTSAAIASGGPAAQKVSEARDEAGGAFVPLTSCYATLADSIQGDCDLDGDVDSDDVAILTAHFYDTFDYGDVITPRQGDVNWDGQLNLDDINIVTTNYGQSLTAIPAMDGVDLDTTLSSKQLSIYDNNTSEYVKRLTNLYDANRTGWHPPVTDAMTQADTNSDSKIDAVPLSDVDFAIINETTDGFDLKVTYHNTNVDELTRSMGCISLTGFNFGHEGLKVGGVVADPIPYVGTKRNMYLGGGETGVGYDSTEYNYPGSIYCPCSVFTIDDYTVGVSIQYPIMEYKHNVTLVTWTSHNGQDGTATWRVLIQPNQGDVEGYNPDANIEYGESREYVVSVRIHEPSATCDTVNDWMRTLRPYRRYFRALYGPVQYTRNDEPVAGYGLALSSSVSANHPFDGTGTNPWGFTTGSDFRPDQHGFDPIVNGYGSPHVDGWFETDLTNGWTRNMVWAPSGSYDPVTTGVSGYSFPPQFTSNWDNCLPSNPDSDLATFGASHELGLWWGYSCEITSAWNDISFHQLDTFDSGDTAFSYAELDGADDVNATYIGLDTFDLPIWEGYWWVRHLRDEYPDFKFVIEPYNCDIMHTLCAQLNVGQASGTHGQYDEYFKYPDGVPIMDFLNPGHEFWVTLSHNWVYNYFNGSSTGYPTEAQGETELQRYADLGVIVTYLSQQHYDRNSGDTYNAAATWTTTVPSDLQ